MNLADSWLPKGAFKPRRYRPGGVGNWSGHLPFANDLLAAIRPRLLVELGTHFGESYFGFCQAVSENDLTCKCYAVDTWVGELHAGYYDESVYHEVDRYNQIHYKPFSYLLRTTFDEARHQFADHSIDVLHIDGLHTYDAVQHDFENWLPAVKPGGIVLLHDIAARHADFGVWKVWQELQGRFKTFDFSHSWGLGILQIPGPVETDNQPLRALFDCSCDEQRNHVRQFYSLCARSLELEHYQSVESPSNASALVQVFPEMAGGYSARERYEEFLNVGEWRHVSVQVLSGSATGNLRVDIAEQPAIIDISALAIRKAATSEEIFRAAGRAELQCLRLGGDMRQVTTSTTNEFARFLSSGADPQLYLQIDSALSDQPLVLHLWVRVNYDVRILESLLTQPQQNQESAGLPQEVIELQQTISALTVHKADLEQLLEQRTNELAQLQILMQQEQDVRAEVEAAKETMSRELIKARAEIDALAASLRRSLDESYVTRRNLALIKGDNDGLKAEYEARLISQKQEHERAMQQLRDDNASSHTSIGILQRHFNELIADRQRLQASHAASLAASTELSHKCGSLEETLQGVLASRSWKLTAPLRNFRQNTRSRS